MMQIEGKHLPLRLAGPARIETADGWSINLPWARHGENDPYAEAEAFAPALVEVVNAYASNQSEIARLREALEFYSDPNRYQGPNQRAEENERHRIGGYRIDVTRDGGEIARAALSGGKS